MMWGQANFDRGSHGAQGRFKGRLNARSGRLQEQPLKGVSNLTCCKTVHIQLPRNLHLDLAFQPAFRPGIQPAFQTGMLFLLSTEKCIV